MLPEPGRRRPTRAPESDRARSAADAARAAPALAILPPAMPALPAMPAVPAAAALLAVASVLAGCGGAPEIELVCADVMRSRCETFRHQWRNDPALTADRIDHIVVTCVLGPCDGGRGTVSVRAVLRDGSVHDLGSGGWRE
jgi:hypothetical protein